MKHTWKYPTEGTRFARSAREAFGHPIQFDRSTRNPDAPAAFACAVGLVVFLWLVYTGAA
jgi:hypothetical protein